MTQIVPFKEKVKDFRSGLEQMKSQLALALPKHITPDRLMRVVLTTVQKTPQILDCTQVSVWGAILQAAQLGLEPDGILGEAYLIPYKDTCQLIPGYKGLIKLARQSGQISTVYAKVVREKDSFRYAYGIKDVLKHVPVLTDEPGPVTHAYAVARLKDGAVQFEVMSVKEIEAIRARSKASKSGPWVTDFEEMAKKTVLRRLCKMLPASVELARAVVLDEQVDANLPQEFQTALDVNGAAQDDAPEQGSPPAPAADGKPKTLDDLAAKAAPAPANGNAPKTKTQKPIQVEIVGGDNPGTVQLERQPGQDG